MAMDECCESQSSFPGAVEILNRGDDIGVIVELVADPLEQRLLGIDLVRGGSLLLALGYRKH